MSKIQLDETAIKKIFDDGLRIIIIHIQNKIKTLKNTHKS